jgi:hypothetical protein
MISLFFSRRDKISDFFYNLVKNSVSKNRCQGKSIQMKIRMYFSEFREYGA